MNRYNPLFEVKKQEVSTQPNIIQNIIKQTQDNIIIDKLSDNYILIARNDKIVSSKYNFQDLIKELKSNFPNPLIPGENVKINKNEISVDLYNDTVLSEKVQKCQDKLIEIQINSKKDMETVSSMTNQIIEIKKDYKANLKKTMSSVDDIYNNVLIFNTSIEESHRETNDSFTKYDKKFNELEDRILMNDKRYFKECNSISDKLEKSNLEFENKLKKIENNNELFEEKMNKELQSNYKKLEKKMNLQQSMMNSKHLELCTTITEDYKKMTKDYDIQIDNKLKIIQDDMNLHIIMNQTEIKKIRKIANDSNQDIQTLKDLDPNSKNTQRIIRTLTDKLHKLDQIFKSMKLVDGV